MVEIDILKALVSVVVVTAFAALPFMAPVYLIVLSKTFLLVGQLAGRVVGGSAKSVEQHIK